MDFIKQIVLKEAQTEAEKELHYIVSIINKTYSEWKKINRRKNAVNIIATAINSLRTISPSYIDLLDPESRAKLAIIIIRCMDLPVWVDVSERERNWKKLYKYIIKLENDKVPTTTNSTLKQILASRLSARIGYKINQDLFVTYENHVNRKYLEYIFGYKMPKHTYKMMLISPLPEDYNSFLDILKINYDKANKKYQSIKKS